MTLLIYLVFLRHQKVWRIPVFCWHWHKIAMTDHSYSSRLLEEQKSRDLLICTALHPEKKGWCRDRARLWVPSKRLLVSSQEKKIFERTASFSFNIYSDTFRSSRYLAADRFGLSKGIPASWQCAGGHGSQRDEPGCERHQELEGQGKNH